MAKSRSGIGNRKPAVSARPGKPGVPAKGKQSNFLEDLADKTRSVPVIMMLGLVLIGWNIMAMMAPVEADPLRYRPFLGDNHAVLVMVNEDKCSFCDQWVSEIEPEYNGSPEGRFAPLVKRRETDPDISILGRFKKNPTFVLIEKDKVVGRLEGFRSDISFWKGLRGLLEKTKYGKSS